MWSETVPKEIFDQCDDTEKKRQEAINEVIYTERDFVRDLEYLRDVRHPIIRQGEKDADISVMGQATTIARSSTVRPTR